MKSMSKIIPVFKSLVIISFLFAITLQAYGQEMEQEKLSTIIVGTHIGTSNGDVENGLGSSISIGYVRHFGNKNNFVVGPYFISGAYRALAIPTDISSQSFKTTSLGIESSYNIHFLRLGTGIECNYSRGLINNTGEFRRVSYGGRVYIGFVKGTKKENIQFEFRPADVLFGTESFLQHHVSFLLHFNLR